MGVRGERRRRRTGWTDVKNAMFLISLSHSKKPVVYFLVN